MQIEVSKNKQIGVERKKHRIKGKKNKKIKLDIR